MKAAVLSGTPRQLSIEDVTVDKPRAKEVLVRLVATGICHSDLHHFENGYHPSGLPTILGHEGSGVVEAVGDDVDYLVPGDHVVGSPRAFCGSCEWCLAGRLTLCRQEGLHRRVGELARERLTDDRDCFQIAGLGTFAELMLVHEHALVKIDPDIPLDRAALLGCGVITGIGAVIRTAQVPPGANVAVVGCGGIGLNCVQGALIAGAQRIVAVDIDDTKLELAKAFGATDTINSGSVDPAEAIREILPGRDGVEYSFEALGRPETYELAFSLTRPGGTTTLIGVLEEEGTFVIRGRDLQTQERRIQGCMLGSVDFRRDIGYFLSLYRCGRIKLDELISHRTDLSHINDAFERLAGGGVTRSVIQF